jgi:hypothetical protein
MLILADHPSPYISTPSGVGGVDFHPSCTKFNPMLLHILKKMKDENTAVEREKKKGSGSRDNSNIPTTFLHGAVRHIVRSPR